MADIVSDLDLRARAAGVSRDWHDAKGCRQRVSDEALSAILERLDAPPAETRFVSGESEHPILLPEGWRAGAASLILETGEARSVILAETDGGVRLMAPALFGYHRLEQGSQSLSVAVAPLRCPAPPAGRLWGSAVQIPSLREGGGAYGDFASLSLAADALGRAGADALAISPVHALFPADARRFSPYAPSSRVFRNVWLAPASEAVVQQEPLIDWAGAAPDRMRDLRLAYDGLPPERRAAFAAWRAEQGERLQVQAIFDALQGYFHARDGASGWRDWPVAFQDPASEAVSAFAADHDDAIAFHAFAQWHAERGLRKAAEAARGAGMAIGLIADLAIGVASDGADSWSRREDLLTGLSIGAPPDPLGPEGQNWGITALSPFALQRQSFAPFIRTLRAVLAHAGGVRIDHALGLCRLWIIPEGAAADQGAYLAMPFDHMMRILKIEAHRANQGQGAIVIGEDLGTVPPGFREIMARAGMLGMRVLPFERDQGGMFRPPSTWDAEAIAMTATHDVATVAGWWKGRDLEWRARIADRPVDVEEVETRDRERASLWATLGDGAPPPDDPAPVVGAAIAAVARTPCPLALVPIEDLLALEEQPNLPGTIDEHPNWRRRLPGPLAPLLERPDVAARIATLDDR